METHCDDKYEILLDGRYFSDLVFTGLPEFPRLGHEVYSREFHLVPGGAFTSAVALHRLGLKVAWPCRFGSDPFSQVIKEKALSAGLDPAFFSQTDQPSLHLTVAFSYENERAFLSYSDATPELPIIETVKKIKPAWLYISNLGYGEKFSDLTSAAHEAGARIYMDCQAHQQSINNIQVAKGLGMVDVFSPNAEEARNLTGETDVIEALGRLAALTPLVIIKLGGEGCLCQSGDQILRVPAIPVQVVETTGAGDNFNCGFLLGQNRGYSLEDSLRIGNICGGLSTQGIGGTSVHINYELVKRYLKS
jgi:sugar/nucleoside kinase (ribokinase family)